MLPETKLVKWLHTSDESAMICSDFTQISYSLFSENWEYWYWVIQWLKYPMFSSFSAKLWQLSWLWEKAEICQKKKSWTLPFLPPTLDSEHEQRDVCFNLVKFHPSFLWICSTSFESFSGDIFNFKMSVCYESCPSVWSAFWISWLIFLLVRQTLIATITTKPPPNLTVIILKRKKSRF